MNINPEFDEERERQKQIRIAENIDTEEANNIQKDLKNFAFNIKKIIELIYLINNDHNISISGENNINGYVNLKRFLNKNKLEEFLKEEAIDSLERNIGEIKCNIELFDDLIKRSENK